MKVLFLGTDWESLEILKAIDESYEHEIVGVITRPDRPVGRKRVMTPSKVREYSEKNNLPVFIPDKDKSKYMEILEEVKPDINVCIAFGEILHKDFLLYPKHQSLNIHFSLLPKYRGAVPIQMAILNGEEETGISFMLMSHGIDEGDVYEIIKTTIDDADTNLSLRKKLIKISKENINRVLSEIESNKAEAKPQDDSQATYCWKSDLAKENAEIQWQSMTAAEVDRAVRAYIPWPTAWFKFQGNRHKLFQVKPLQTAKLEPSEIKEIDGKLIAGTKDKDLQILELQQAGKSKVTGKEYAHGMKKS